MPTDELLFWIAFAAATVLGILKFTRKGGAPDNASANSDISWAGVFACVLAAVCLRFFTLLLLSRMEFVAVDGDEFARWIISGGWAKYPYFFTYWDGIWLSGSIAYYGSFIRLFDDSILAIQVANGLAQCAGFAGLAYAGWVMGGSRTAAAATPLIAAVSFPFVWQGFGAMSETLMSACVAPAFACCVQFVQCDSRCTRKKLLYALTSAILIFVIASHHFIGWFAILTGLPLLIAAFCLNSQNRTPSAFAGLGLIFVGAGLFPLLWMWGSWRHLGGPFTFLENASRLNKLHLAYEPETGIPAWWVYPRLFALQVGPMLFLVLSSAISSARPYLQFRRIILGLFALGFLAVFSVRAELSGYAVSRHRYILLLPPLIFVLAGAGVADLTQNLSTFRRLFSMRNLTTAFALMAFFAGWWGYNLSTAFQYDRHNVVHYWPYDSFAVGDWLRREFRHPKSLSAVEIAGPIGVYDGADGGVVHVGMAYAAGDPFKLVEIPQAGWPSQVTPEMHLLITNDPLMPPGFIPVANFGQWRVLRRR